ncbi:MAG: hypothetical protein RIC35_22615 [Marinoscillum sp.]
MNFLRSKTKTILLTGFIAGTLDIISAIVIFADGNVTGVLKFIASGAIGNAAMDGGYEMVCLGLIIHYIIAYSFTVGFFLIYPLVPLLRKSILINTIFYGCFIWSFMNFLILPLTHNPPGPVELVHVSTNIGILIYAIGFPVVFMAKRHYSKSTH